jgi:hypothetical protein
MAIFYNWRSEHLATLALQAKFQRENFNPNQLSFWIDRFELQLGIAHYDRREYPDAKTYFENISLRLSRDPSNTTYRKARLWLGKTFIEQGNNEEGLSIMRELAEPEGGAPDAIAKDAQWFLQGQPCCWPPCKCTIS